MIGQENFKKLTRIERLTSNDLVRMKDVKQVIINHVKFLKSQLPEKLWRGITVTNLGPLFVYTTKNKKLYEKHQKTIAQISLLVQWFKVEESDLNGS